MANWQYPRQRRWKRALSNNALVAGVISAIVAGVISYGVARYQVDDAARQAIASQQVTELVQLEQTSQTLYEETNGLYVFEPKCNTYIALANSDWDHCVARYPYYYNIGDGWATIDAEASDITDTDIDKLAKQFSSDSLMVEAERDLKTRYKDWISMLSAYGKLIRKCGQVIQGH